MEDGRLELEKRLKVDVTNTRGTCVSSLVSCLAHGCGPGLKPKFDQTLDSQLGLSVPGDWRLPHLLNVRCDLN